MHEGHHHGKPAPDVLLLHSDPAEVVQARQADVLDDEFEVGEVGRGVVDVVAVEGVLGQRGDGRPFVDVHVGDAELFAELEAAIGLGVVEPPAARGAAPFCGVELDAPDTVGLLQRVQVLQRGRALAWVEGAVEDETIRVRLGDDGVLLGGVEALDVELLEIGRLDDRHVHRPVDK